MRSGFTRRLLTTLSVSPEAVKLVSASVYGAALGFQLHYVKSMVANPAKANDAVMRRAGMTTAWVESGLYAEALARFGDDFLAAQEAHRRKRSVLDVLLAVDEQSRWAAVTRRSVRALRSSVLGPAPMILPACSDPGGHRKVWTPKDRRVEHQLLVVLEERLRYEHGAREKLPALTEANLLLLTDQTTGLVLPWDDAVARAGTEVVDNAVREYLLDSRYGDAILNGARAFNAARCR